MKKQILLSSFLLSVFIAKAGNEDYPIGARSAAMGNASVSLSDMWSAHHNQAGLGFVRNISAGVSYENRFMVKEISVRGGVLAIPVKAGTFGLCITNFGYQLYSENKYSLSFAKAFGEKFSAAIAMDYLTTRIAEGYGNKGALAAEAGIQAKPIKALTIGAHVFNPTRAKISSYDDERLPTIIRLGPRLAREADHLVSQRPGRLKFGAPPPACPTTPPTTRRTRTSGPCRSPPRPPARRAGSPATTRCGPTWPRSTTTPCSPGRRSTTWRSAV